MNKIILLTVNHFSSYQGYIFWPFPPPWGVGNFFSKLKNREEFEGGLEKIAL